MQIKECLGKWVLWNATYLYNDESLKITRVMELGVDKLSPSGDFVRVLMSSDDEDQTANWFKLSEFEPYILEIVGEIEYFDPLDDDDICDDCQRKMEMN